MGHTPTPWTQYMGGPMIHGADGFYIGIMQGKNADKDAAYIVECVNSHASLVEEVERLRGALIEMRDAAERQLAGIGKGIVPSDRLQDAIDAANLLMEKFNA